MNPGIVLGKLNPYKGSSVKIVSDQDTDDIINSICKAHNLYADDYKKIALYFKGDNYRKTAKKIYDFLKKNVKYKIESSEKQTVKSPAAIVAEGSTVGGDCKHYSLFSGGILQQLKIPFSYRFASYKLLDKIPGHVFTVINPGTENEIWIDPVLSYFDYKKPYTYSTDRKMAIYSVSGIGATKAEKKQAKQEKKSARQAAGKTLGQKIKKGAKAVLKVAGAPARAAFLLLVTENFANLAKKYADAWQRDPSSLKKHWEEIGGKIDALKKAWEKGSKKKRIFGDDDSIGAAPLAAAVAAAAPIIAKAGEFLKKIGIDPADIVEIGKQAVNDKAQELTKKLLQPKAAKEASEIETGEIVTEPVAAIDQVQKVEKPITSAKNKMMLPLLIGGAALLYFATRKK
jgi:hypothetical protein